MNVSGSKQPRMVGGMFPGQDKRGIYAALCAEFARSINWEIEDVVFWWSQIALVRERHNAEPRALAEYMAMRNVRDALDCRGRAGS